MKIIREIQKHGDKRGWLGEVLREDIVGEFKQVYVVTIDSGEVRGNHYHKIRKEWFCVVRGKAKLTLWHRDTPEDSREIKLSGGEEKLVSVEIEPYTFHKIENTGVNEVVMISGTSDLYDPENSDKYEK